MGVSLFSSVLMNSLHCKTTVFPFLYIILILFSAELKINNVLMKMQVYELLTCLCMYSDEGYAGMGYHLSITALQHYKVITHCVEL